MRPSNPPANMTLFKNLESVATAPQLLEEIPKRRVYVGGGGLSLAGLDRSPKFEIAAEGVPHSSAGQCATIKTQIGNLFGAQQAATAGGAWVYAGSCGYASYRSVSRL
jgi:hypothetical protein